MNKLREFIAAQFRPMHKTESVNYRLSQWLRHPVQTLRLWRAHHNPSIERAVRAKWDDMVSRIESGEMLFRHPDESDEEFRKRLLSPGEKKNEDRGGISEGH